MTENGSDLTEVVIGAGFLEKVYERALIQELALRGVCVKAQVSFPIPYKGKYLGEYAADLVVGEKVIVELKCRGPLCQSAVRDDEGELTGCPSG